MFACLALLFRLGNGLGAGHQVLWNFQPEVGLGVLQKLELLFRKLEL